MIKRRDKRIWCLISGIFIAVFSFTFLAQKHEVLDNNVGAANVSAFDPGYIISDFQMGNYNSMDESQIQSFLKSKNSCWDTNLGRYTAGDKVSYFSEISPPRTWHVKDGHFVCMADEVFDGGTAAHIIYQAAQDYRINPQVLLVLLEKEQSLVTDTFPHSQQYRSATGYGCPDTAACSSQYYGLKNQIRNAASLFRTVLNGGWTNYPLGNNYVQYNPSASCGGSVVNIRNLATSALYRYTPYQPNAATLGGWSDGCNAYGNLNFYKLFEDWFGGITDEMMTVQSARIVEGEYIIISSLDNNEVLDVDVNSIGTPNVKIEEKTESELQRWLINADGAGYYTIINPTTGKAIDVEGASTEKGANVQLYRSNGTCAQKWQIIEND
ncbi:RICIN domain-containing protein, partial [Candidatus Saccharibacteria bacterium]|nr:RICIN domain-containing protein [Candidatus Saccharibacteria bacterium]